MQTLKAAELFKSIQNVDNRLFENSNGIEIDFSNVKSIDLKGVITLLNIQKVAILNNNNLSLSNVNPNVSQILDITGLNKTLANSVKRK